MSRQVTIDGPEAMRRLGAALAAAVAPGDVVLLHGDLGAGKTTLAQGFATALGITAAVNSPTFTFAGTYTAPGAPRGIARMHHLDLYRLEDAGELEGIGFDAYVTDPAAVTLVEWPERAGADLPAGAWTVEIDYAGPDRRTVRIGALSPADRGAAIAGIAGGFSAAG